MPVIFPLVYVQFGTRKQKFRPWRTAADFSFIEGSPDDPLHIDDFGEAPDDGGLIVGLTVERLKREATFGIPSSAVAMRNGAVLADGDLVEPGDLIEFVRRRKRQSTVAAQPVLPGALQGGTTLSPAGLSEQSPPETTAAEDHDPSKLVLSRNDFTARYKGLSCALGNVEKFTLLEYLKNVKPPGRCVSLIELKQEVWGVNSPVKKGAIQKQVSLLKGKLCKAGISGIKIDGSLRGHYRLILS